MANTKIRGSKQIIDNSIFDLQISDTAAIQTHKLAEGALFVKSDGTVPFTAPQSGVDPTQPNHLVTKSYLDGAVQSLDIKGSVKVATTSDITLSGVQTIDGVSVVSGDRVLVKNQIDPTQNGIYTVSTGAWARSIDADTDAEVTGGMFVFVEEGTTHADTGWVLKTDGPTTLGTTALEFTQFSGAGSFVSGAGLIRTGNQIDIVSDNAGITVNADSIALTLDGTSLEITPNGLKLAPLPDGQFLIGDATGEAAAKTITGDINIDGAGQATINLPTGAIFVGDGNGKAQGVIISGAISIDTAGITNYNITDGTMLIGDINGIGQEVTITGDMNIDNTGVASLNLTQANIYVGQANGKAANVPVSGEIAIDETGNVTFTRPVLSVDQYVVRETPAGVIDGVNTTFTLANTPIVGTEMLFWNGLLLDEGAANDYTITGSTITLAFAPEAGEKLKITYYK